MLPGTGVLVAVGEDVAVGVEVNIAVAVAVGVEVTIDVCVGVFVSVAVFSPVNTLGVFVGAAGPAGLLFFFEHAVIRKNDNRTIAHIGIKTFFISVSLDFVYFPK